MNIMVIDDTPLSRKMMVRALKAVETSITSVTLIIKVYEGSDGKDSLIMMSKSVASRKLINNINNNNNNIYYDIIFIDSEMIEMNGSIAIEKLRNEYNYNGKIYAITGHANITEHMKLKESGANEVYVKPLLVGQLKIIIEEYINNLPPEEINNSNNCATPSYDSEAVNKPSTCNTNNTNNSNNENDGGGILMTSFNPNELIKPRLSITKSNLLNMSINTNLRLNNNNNNININSIIQESPPPPKQYVCLNVMVVDDTLMHRKMIIKLLQTIEIMLSTSLIILKIITHEGEDGLDALTLMSKSLTAISITTNETIIENSLNFHFDLIFIDYNMLQMNGDVAIQNLRLKYQYKGPIYAVTANESIEDNNKLRLAGATDVYIKPLKIEQAKVIIEGIFIIFITGVFNFR